jgi:glycerol-3-phosphate dehydrogenase
MNRQTREDRWAALPSLDFDVMVVGGGVHGSCIYHHLRTAGYRVLLSEAGDYASGTSQASAMMIWGGLLYLKNADFATVWRLSRSRDLLLAGTGSGVRPLTIRYLGDRPGASCGALVRAALHLYWFLGSCRRRRPALETRFPEQQLLKGGTAWRALTYEEGRLEPSDARFVLRWICGGSPDAGLAFNYCRLLGGGFDPRRQRWHLELEDTLSRRVQTASTRWVVNASGVWTDRVNAFFRIEAPYRHLFSKGVFLGLPRCEQHQAPLILGDDHYAWIPWGPIAVWGSTETILLDLEAGFTPSPEEVRFLLGELNRHVARPIAAGDIISLRCGVRPIAVPRDSPEIDSRKVSRRPHLWFARDRPWACVYGGNITFAVPLARQVVAAFRQRLSPARGKPMADVARTTGDNTACAPRISFPGLPGDFPAPGWCAAHEDCWHLEDYLRRRTNIAQWVPRAGLGARDEHRPFLERLARDLYGSEGAARQAVEDYRARVVRDFDRVVQAR